MSNYDGAVLILGFNRPDKMSTLIANLSEVKPTRVYVAVDGPRLGNTLDQVKVTEVRECVELIDWDCEVHSLFQSENMGCRQAVIAAIDWFFSKEEFGIILEDDVLPDQSFFNFIIQMKRTYQNDERIMHISGGINSSQHVESEFDHYFSKFVNVWGWATWSDRWQKFNLEQIASSRNVELVAFTKHFERYRPAFWFQRYVWESKSPLATSWAVPWAYSIIKHNGIVISPTSNLVFNSGFDETATHGTNKTFAKYAKLPISRWESRNGVASNTEGLFLDDLRFNLIRVTDPNLRIWQIIRFHLKLMRFMFIPAGVNSMLARVKPIAFGRN